MIKLELIQITNDVDIEILKSRNLYRFYESYCFKNKIKLNINFI